MPTISEKKCPRCGGAFACHQESGCWCTAVLLNPEMLAKLRAEYSDCLCEGCLRVFAVDREAT